MVRRLLVAGVLGAAMLAAQGRGIGEGGGEGLGSGMGGGNERGMGGGGMGMRARTPAKFEAFSDKLKLTKDQKDEIATIFDDAQKESAQVRDILTRGRGMIAQAMQAGKDEDVKKMIEAYGGAAAQMTGVELKAFSKVYAMLKPNQQKNAGQAFELMAGIFQQRDWKMAR